MKHISLFAAAALALAIDVNVASAQDMMTQTLLRVDRTANHADSSCHLREDDIRSLWVIAPGRGDDQTRNAETLIEQAEKVCRYRREEANRGPTPLPPELQRHLR
jgi:hypothetical protein